MLIRLRSVCGHLAGFEIWLVAALVLAGMAFERLLPGAIIAAALFWVLRWVGIGHPIRRTQVTGGMLLLALMVFITLWVTAVPEKTLPQVYRLLGGMALFFAIVGWGSSRSRLNWLWVGLEAGGLVLALAAPFVTTWPEGKLPYIPAEVYARFPHFAGDTINPNVLGAALALLLPLPAASLLYNWRHSSWPERLLALAAFGGILGVLILSQSRGAWLGVLASLGLLMLLRGRWGWLALLLAIAGAGFAAYRLGVPRLLDLLLSGGAIGGLDGRLEIWSRAIYMVQDFPFTGIGLGSFGDVADLLYPFSLATPGGIPHAHNLFLQVAVDMGLPGLIAWLSVLMAVLASAWSVYRAGRTRGDSWLAGLGAGLLASSAALLVHGLLDANLWGMTKPAPLVWAVWGLALASWQVVHHREAQSVD